MEGLHAAILGLLLHAMLFPLVGRCRLDQGSEEQFRGSASAIMQSLTSRSKEIKQSEREGDKVAEDNSESARLLSTLQKYNISNDEVSECASGFRNVLVFPHQLTWIPHSMITAICREDDGRAG